MPTTSPIAALTSALHRAGYSHRPDGYGVLWPCTPERLHELAAATRRRSLWHLTAALCELATGLALAGDALPLPTPHERLPGLAAADAHYVRACDLARPIV